MSILSGLIPKRREEKRNTYHSFNIPSYQWFWFQFDCHFLKFSSSSRCLYSLLHALPLHRYLIVIFFNVIIVFTFLNVLLFFVVFIDITALSIFTLIIMFFFPFIVVQSSFSSLPKSLSSSSSSSLLLIVHIIVLIIISIVIFILFVITLIYICKFWELSLLLRRSSAKRVVILVCHFRPSKVHIF